MLVKKRKELDLDELSLLFKGFYQLDNDSVMHRIEPK